MIQAVVRPPVSGGSSGWEKVVRFSSRVHSDRATGRDRDHRRVDRAALAGRPGSA